jgi:hypothetical protein
VFVKRMLRRRFGTNKKLVKGGFRRLHNEGLHNLYASPSSIRVIKLRRMRLAVYAASMG